jgi:hypothetical protein
MTIQSTAVPAGAVIGQPTSLHVATPTQLRLAQEHRERQARMKAAAQRVNPPAEVLFQQTPEIVAPVIVEIVPPVVEHLPSLAEQFATAWEMLDATRALNPLEPIIRASCRYFGMPRNDLCGQTRSAPITRARHVAMYLCRIMTGRSTPDIGRKFGDRDHTTVLHAINKVKERIETCEETRNAIRTIAADVMSLKDIYELPGDNPVNIGSVGDDVQHVTSDACEAA